MASIGSFEVDDIKDITRLIIVLRKILGNIIFQAGIKNLTKTVNTVKNHVINGYQRNQEAQPKAYTMTSDVVHI